MEMNKNATEHIRLTLQVCALLAGFQHFDAYADDFEGGIEYVSWEDRSLWLVPPQAKAVEGYLAFVEHFHYTAEFCEPESEFFCVFGIQYAFSVPKKLTLAEKSWTLRGVEFRVLERGIRFTMLGSTYEDVLVIETPSEATAVGRESGIPSYSLYSPEYGLIGFQMQADSPVFWSRKRRGFGAKE